MEDSLRGSLKGQCQIALWTHFDPEVINKNYYEEIQRECAPIMVGEEGTRDGDVAGVFKLFRRIFGLKVLREGGTEEIYHLNYCAVASEWRRFTPPSDVP